MCSVGIVFVTHYRVVRCMMMWLEIAKGDIVKDPVFQQMLGNIQDSLIRDKLDSDMKELTVKLTQSIKQRQGAALGEGVNKASIIPVCVMYRLNVM